MKRLSLVLLLVFAGLATAMAQRTIQGTITDEGGEPLIGATVVAQGTSSGAITEIDGSFSLTVPEGTEAITVSYTGYETQSIELGASNIVNVTLQSGVTIDEVIVTGYGEESKRNLTSSVSSVDTRAFENVNVQNFEQAIQGRLAGVNVTGSAGTLGSQQTVRVRGVGSINASNQPLYVIDGQIINSSQESGAPLGGPGTNPLVNINQNDIASIDVLKDAAAAAVYGARGANGVIVVTTKSGSYNQKPKVDIGYSIGFAEPTEQLDLLSGPEYAQLWNQAAENRGFTPESGLFYDDPASEPDAQWLDQVYRDQAVIHDMRAGVQGGTSDLKYYINASYRNQEGTVKSTRLQRYSFRANLETQISDKLKVGINLNPTRTENDRQNEDNNVASPQTYAILAFPNLEPFDENGDVVDGFVTTSNGQAAFAGTPLGNIVGQDITTTTTQVLAKPYVQYNFLPELSLTTEFATQYLQIEDAIKQGSGTTDGFAVSGAADALNTQVLNWQWKTLANYGFTSGDHALDLLASFELQSDRTSGFSVFGNTFADDRLQVLDAAANITGGGGFLTEARFVRTIGKADYRFKDRYLLSGTLVYEGSSRFGANERFGVFPAVSAGWIVSEEPFMVGSPFNFLKLRASWGEVGNAQFGNFASRGLIEFGQDYNFIPGFVFSQLANNDLTWERAQTLDFGLEFALLNSRLRGEVGYFIKDTKDLLLSVPLPRTIGIFDNTILQNAGEIRNMGFEFQLDYQVLDGEFKWNIGFTGATLDNEIRQLIDNNGDGEDDDISPSSEAIHRVGETVGSWFLVPYAGVDPATGDALFEGPDGETIVNQTPSSARRILGNPIPDFQGGFTTDLSYKNFFASAFFQFAQGHQLYLAEQEFYRGNFASLWNQDRTALDAWTPENTDTDIPEARLFQGNGNQESGRWLSDADFIRLKNVQFGYNFRNIGPSNMNLQLFFSGQNLATFTDFEGLDPEANGNDNDAEISGDIFFSRPQNKVFTFGANLNF